MPLMDNGDIFTEAVLLPIPSLLNVDKNIPLTI